MSTIPGYKELMASRPPEFEHDDAQFWILGDFNGGKAWVGRFRGESPWTRHPGDSFFFQAEGQVTLELLHADGDQAHTVDAGTPVRIPGGTWYRVTSDGWAVQTGANPGETEHFEGKGRPQ